MTIPTEYRPQVTVEIGPNVHDNNWKVYELSPDAFEDAKVFEAEWEEIEGYLDELDDGQGNDSGGPLARQVRLALWDLHARRLQGKEPSLRMFVFALPGENNNVDVNLIPSNALEDME